jgi:transcription antitermination factor NusG
MPLLREEPCVFPENLFLGPVEKNEEDRWMVLHTKPRSEKALARRLLNKQVAFFLPQFRKEWRHRGRRLSSYLPLFPGYVFLYGNWEARLHSLETNLVANTLNVLDQAQLFQDLLQVHQLMTSGAPLSPEERLKPGARVEIIDGPFAGMEGKIISRKNLRLVVEVRFIHQGVSVDIENWMIRTATSSEQSALLARN